MKKEELLKLEKEEIIEVLFAVIEQLTARISELETRLNQNSNNSSKPPSSDGLNKPPAKSLRQKTGRKPGGQVGHKGHGLKLEREPDEVVTVNPIECDKCGFNLSMEPMQHADTRYVYDIVIEVKLVQYIIQKAICPQCKSITVGSPPPECKGTQNYGNAIRALCVVMTNYANVSIDKTRKILRDLLDIPISGGTIKTIQRECAAKTSDAIKEIKKHLLASPTLGVDETGCRIAGKTQWIHVASNSKYTLLSVHGKRGREGIESGGIVSEYEGTLIHDCWSPYFGFDKCKHALCVAHLMRELIALIESGQVWATDMLELLLEMKNVVDRYKDNDKTELSNYYRNKFAQRYDEILSSAKQEIVPSTTRKKSKAENLLIRLEKYQIEIIRFTEDFDVPFDNNQAERDIRNVKVKQKVSGCHRTEDDARDYANTASVIGTVIKLGKSVVGAVRGLFDGQNPVAGATE